MNVKSALQQETRIDYLLEGFLTWFLKLFVKQSPCFCDSFQALFHGLDVHIGAVAFWELGATAAPAIVVLADKFALSITGYVAESSLNKTFSQVVWKDHLQACKTKLGLVPSSNFEVTECQWKCSGSIELAELISYLINLLNCVNGRLCYWCWHRFMYKYFSEESVKMIITIKVDKLDKPCSWTLFSGLWTSTELTESRLS